LIARRASISPSAAGVGEGSKRRRTPGLRREEVAALAGVGLSWYTWLEQGRQISVSAQTLDRIAQALSLTPTDTTCLFDLAGVRSEAPAIQRASDATVQAAVDACARPAFVASACWDIEAYNELANRIFRFDAFSGPFSQNHFWRLFMDADRRALYVDWTVVAEASVGHLRTVSATSSSEPRVGALIRALTEHSADFARMWRAQRTTPLSPFIIRLQPPRVERLDFTSLRLQFPGADGRLFVLLLPDNVVTVKALERLQAAGSRRRKTKSRMAQNRPR